MMKREDEDRIGVIVNKDLRDRKIQQLQAKIAANPPPSRLIGIAWVSLLSVVTVMIGSALSYSTGIPAWVLLQPAAVIGYGIWFFSKREDAKRLRKQLNELLAQEERDIDREIRGQS